MTKVQILKIYHKRIQKLEKEQDRLYKVALKAVKANDGEGSWIFDYLFNNYMTASKALAETAKLQEIRKRITNVPAGR